MSATSPDLFADPASYPQGAEFLGQLLRSLERSRHLANFACGGNVPIHNADTSKDHAAASPRPSPQVVIRWDSPVSPKDSRVRKVVLSGTSSDKETVAALVADCQPATSGLGQQDVLDESYRKAGKMEPTAFSTNFCPYETGIMDAVTAALFSETVDDKEHVSLGVWAELYKLNVYSGPSGKFKAHVDTPRSDKQFGSLVICFPYPHSGGALEVRHEGQVIKFDWSKDSDHANDIQWAAFYSDCEHEVMEVTSGHRITLTYNLYYKSVPASSPFVPLPMDAKQTPFYSVMRSLLRMPEFLKDGGSLGIYCSHSYPHTNPQLYTKIPYMLKGADAVVYRSLIDLPGVSVRLLPVLQKGVDYDDLYKYERYLWKQERGEDPYTYSGSSSDTDEEDRSSDSLLRKLLNEKRAPAETYDQYKQRMGGKALSPSMFRYNKREGTTMKTPLDVAGAALQPWSEIEGYASDDVKYFAQDLQNGFPVQLLRNVQWLNKEHSKEISLFYVAYGNQAETGYVYSYLSFIVSILPYEQRQLDATD